MSGVCVICCSWAEVAAVLVVLEMWQVIVAADVTVTVWSFNEQSCISQLARCCWVCCPQSLYACVWSVEFCQCVYVYVWYVVSCQCVYVCVWSVATVTVTEALVLHSILEDRGRITESIRILVPVDRIKQKFFSDRDETSPLIAAVSAPSAACSMLMVQQQKKLCYWFINVSAAWWGCHVMRHVV